MIKTRKPWLTSSRGQTTVRNYLRFFRRAACRFPPPMTAQAWNPYIRSSFTLRFVWTDKFFLLKCSFLCVKSIRLFTSLMLYWHWTVCFWLVQSPVVEIFLNFLISLFGVSFFFILLLLTTYNRKKESFKHTRHKMRLAGIWEKSLWT